MPLITGDTKLFGVLSQGATFTLSPCIHNRAAKLMHKDLVYMHFDLASDRVAAFLDVFWHLGGQGLNVTMPHKNLVASLVESSGLESVNTLVRGDKGWHGYSTDGEGFMRGLDRASVKISEFDFIIILGSGGAAQAILNSIAKETIERPPMIIVHRRSNLNDQKIRDAISLGPSQLLTLRRMTPQDFDDTLRSTKGLRRLVIQATSAPKAGDDMSAYAPAMEHLTAADCVIDIIYDHPSQIYFSAIRLGLKCLDGLPMLIEQARLSQFLWWKKAASFDELVWAIKESGWKSR